MPPVPDSHSSRRRFLRQSSAAAAGTILLPQLLACASSNGRDASAASAKTQDAALGSGGRDGKLGIALLGLGGYAKGQIAPALQLTEHCYIAGLITGSPEKLPEWQRKYDIADEHCYTYDTMDEIANDDAIDVVYVITPTATHKDFSVRAARAGKHVWCEKPMAMDVAECRAIIDACEAAGVRLAIGYRMMHEPRTREFIAYTAARPLGALTSASAEAGYGGSVPSPDYWRGQRDMGGGALYDMGVYAINGLRYGTQLLPEAVLSARQDRVDRPNGVDTTSEFVLRLPGNEARPDGVEAEGWTSVVEKGNQLRVEFERGWAEMDPMQPYQGVRGEASDGTAFEPPVPNQQSIQMDNDALAIMNGTELIAPGIEGLIDVAIIRAVIESAETGREVAIAYPTGVAGR